MIFLFFDSSYLTSLANQNSGILFCLRAWWSKRLTTRHTYATSARFCGMPLCSVVSKNDLQAHLMTGLKSTCTKVMDMEGVDGEEYEWSKGRRETKMAVFAARKRKALMDVLYYSKSPRFHPRALEKLRCNSNITLLTKFRPPCPMYRLLRCRGLYRRSVLSGRMSDSTCYPNHLLRHQDSFCRI